MKQLLLTPIHGFNVIMSDDEYASHIFVIDKCSKCGVKIFKSATPGKYFIKSKYNGLTCDEIILMEVLL